MATAPLVEVRTEGRVGYVQLQRPERLNAVTLAMIGDIRRSVLDLVADPNVFGIVITGSGRGFCAGLDMSDLANSAASGQGSSKVDSTELPALFSFLLRVPKPVIAAVNGVAAGGGFVLAMMCDLRFAARDAASFTTSFSKRGLIAEHGTSWLLPRIVGLNRSLDLLWSSRRIDAGEAYRIGFVDRLVDDELVVAEATSYLTELASSVSPRSIARMKATVLRGLSLPIDEALGEVNAEMDEALRHPDATEGVASFVERRPPAFAPWTGALL